MSYFDDFEDLGLRFEYPTAPRPRARVVKHKASSDSYFASEVGVNSTIEHTMTSLCGVTMSQSHKQKPHITRFVRNNKKVTCKHCLKLIKQKQQIRIDESLYS